MANQGMVEIMVHDVPEELHQKIQKYARAQNMTVEDAASYILSGIVKSYIKKQEFEEDREYFEVFAKMWDKGLNSFDKLSKAIDIADEHDSDLQEAVDIINKTLIDKTSQPELPYNPYRKLLEEYASCKRQEVTTNA